MARREGDTLTPVVVTYSGTTLTELEEASIARVQLLLSPRARTGSAAVVDVDDTDPDLTWVLVATATAFVLTVTWMPPVAAQFPRNNYVGSVRVYDAAGKVLVGPSDDPRDVLQVLPDLIEQDEE